MAFGISGKKGSPEMVGSDVAVGFIQNGKSSVFDLNIDAKSVVSPEREPES